MFWTDILLSPEAPICLSHPWFLYNVAVQLHSNDFPISYMFKISDFNKHLLDFVSNENFSQPAGVFLSNSTSHDIIYMLMILIYMSLYFLFFSTFLIFCFSYYFSICQIKANCFKVNNWNFLIPYFPLSAVNCAVMNCVANSLEIFVGFFPYCVWFLPRPLSRCLNICVLSLNAKKKTQILIFTITFLGN